MSDDWGDLEGLPEPKRGVPRWLWACGCGCLLLVIAGIGIAGLGFRWISTGTDTTVQWERVATVLPYDDDQLGRYTLLFGQDIPFIDLEVFVFARSEDGIDDREPRISGYETLGESETGETGEGGNAAEVESASDESDDVDSSASQFRSSPAYVAILLYGEDSDLEDEDLRVDGNKRGSIEHGTLVIQGRELDVVRARYDQNNSLWGAQAANSGESIIVDLSEEGDAKPLQLMLVRQNSDKPVPDEAVEEFLRPFHVGPNR